MTFAIDLKVLSARESEQVEWKENVADVLDVVETVVAFANDLSNLGGGYVVCGGRETKDEHGFQRLELTGLTANRLREVEGAVMSACLSHVDPPLHPLTTELLCDHPDRRVLVFIVPASNRAHSFRRKQDTGKHYVRVGRETREARNGLLRELLVRKGAIEPWDRQPHPHATVDDLDLLALRDLLTRIGVWDAARGLEPFLEPGASVSPLMPSFCVREPMTGIVRPRHFTLLLVAREPHRFFPDAHTIFSMYPGADRSEPYSERAEVTGTLTTQVQRLLALLDTQALALIDKVGPGAPNATKYPRRALHEAVVNAIVHRDYAAAHPVRVTAFADRIEIQSPGSLPSAVEAEDFVRGVAMPVWRNQSLAWVMNKLQLAQAEGQGIATILRTMVEEGCPPPIFKLTPDSVACTLPAHPRFAQVRDLQEIERLFALGDLAECQRRLDSLLERDPFNTRTIQLFCEIERALGEPRRIVAFLERNEHNIGRMSSLAQVLLADAITEFQPPRGSPAELLAHRLLGLAASGRFTEVETRRLVVALLRLRDPVAALSALDRAIREAGAPNATFLQLRGRTLIQLAKRCGETARIPGTPAHLRDRAWEEYRTYLDRAERDLLAALEHTTDTSTQAYANDDLAFARHLRLKAERSRGGRRR